MRVLKSIASFTIEATHQHSDNIARLLRSVHPLVCKSFIGFAFYEVFFQPYRQLMGQPTD